MNLRSGEINSPGAWLLLRFLPCKKTPMTFGHVWISSSAKSIHQLTAPPPAKTPVTLVTGESVHQLTAPPPLPAKDPRDLGHGWISSSANSTSPSPNQHPRDLGHGWISSSAKTSPHPQRPLPSWPQKQRRSLSGEAVNKAFLLHESDDSWKIILVFTRGIA